ncbi:MAG: tetratricopeptide repeat protein [Leptospirales bacterium]|nr:tetratricopeptide repeat protein [Leptospirales bacterium]
MSRLQQLDVNTFYAARPAQRNPQKMRPGLAALLAAAALSFAAAALYGQSSAYLQGKQQLAHRNFDEAFQSFQRALNANPGDGNPLYYMGYIQEQRNRRAEAVAYYRRAIDLRMDNDLRRNAFWKIVLYYKVRRDWENLLVYSERFLAFQDIGEVRKLREMAAQNRDPRAAAHAELLREAREHARANRIEQSIQAYRQALRQDPDSESARWELSLQLMEKRDFASADSELRRLLQSRNEDWEVYYKAGICSLNLRRGDQALQDLENARRLNSRPTEAFVYFVNLAEARIHLDREDFPAAERLLREALQKRATPSANAALAVCEWARGDQNSADRRSRQALNADGALFDALLVQTDLRSRQDASDALELGQRLLNALDGDNAPSPAAPRYARALLYVGRKAAMRQDWSLALRAFDRINLAGLNTASAVSLRDYNFYYGLTLLRSNQLDRSINQLARVEQSPQADYYIAEAGARQRNMERVRLHLKRAGDADAAMWTRADGDPIFQTLAAEDANFAAFLRQRGAPPPETAPPGAEPLPTSSTTSSPSPH